MFGFRNKLKSAVKNVFGVDEEANNNDVNWSSPKVKQEVKQEVKPEVEQQVEMPEEQIEEVEAPEKEEAVVLQQGVASDPAPVEGGLELNIENLEEIFDDFIRPGLQADGGDITLERIEGIDIYVKLTGACSSCSSSIMTMKLGVEALLREEFPQMGELYDITHA
jgi:Fe-S cluster biogenesis protein NfuA